MDYAEQHLHHNALQARACRSVGHLHQEPSPKPLYPASNSSLNRTCAEQSIKPSRVLVCSIEAVTVQLSSNQREAIVNKSLTLHFTPLFSLFVLEIRGTKATWPRM